MYIDLKKLGGYGGYTKEKITLFSIWKHRNGNLYIVLGITNRQGSPERREEYPLTIVYMNVKKFSLWSRKVDAWHRSMKRVF